MKNFDKIIKQKADGYEVPFNEAHWSEMDARLTKAISNRTKKLFIGSATVVISLLVAAYFINPFNPTTELNSQEQIIVEELSMPINSSVEVQVATSPEKKEINVVEDNSVETTSYKSTTITEKTPITSSKPQEQIKKTTTPVLEVKEKETIISEVALPEEPTNLEKNLKVSSLEITRNEDDDSTPATQEIISTSETEKTNLVGTNLSKSKNSKYKPYRDENISKKNVKRSRKGFFSFLKFKKKRYKVPLAKKRSAISENKK